MELNEIEEMVKGVRADLDNILNLAKQSEDSYNYEQKLNGFKERNSEKLDKYVDRLKKLNGDDFDLYKSAMDEYDESFSDLEESDYIEQLVGQIDSKIEALKEALTDATDAAEETVENVTVENEGDETKVEAENTEGETVAEAETEDNDINSEVSENEDEAEQPGEEDADKELEDFQKELDEEYELYKKHEENKDKKDEEE